VPYFGWRCGWLCLIMAGGALFWLALWLVMPNYGWLWLVVLYFGWLSLVVPNYGWLCLILAGFVAGCA